jgi:DNA-binding NarL/FixJ family response regulator
MNRTKLLLADDHVMLIESLVHMIRQEFDIVGIASDGRALLEMARLHHPDVIVTDISMPQLNGIDAARILRKETNSARLLFLTMYADLPLVEEAFRAGASGYAQAVQCGRIRESHQCVAKGDLYHPAAGRRPDFDASDRKRSGGLSENDLTLRQREVLQLLAEGRP